jgi:NAD-dependent dihydropyrimidine dehydrogenase PreA subunit
MSKKFNSFKNDDGNGAKIGQCTEMCPIQEYNMRIKNNLVNILEKTFNKK